VIAKTALVATAVAYGMYSAEVSKENEVPWRDPYSTPKDLRMLYEVAVRSAPTASYLSGYEISEEMAVAMAYTITHKEQHHTNACHNCDGGSPLIDQITGGLARDPVTGKVIKDRNDRAGGFFSLTVPAFCRASRTLGLDYPDRKTFADDEGGRDLWTKASCLYMFGHPKQQVGCFFVIMANQIRAGHGNLYTAWGGYRWGVLEPCDFSVDCRSIWKRRYPWPPNGKLKKVGTGASVLVEKRRGKG
jgi:hypothetical protein